MCGRGSVDRNGNCYWQQARSSYDQALSNLEPELSGPLPNTTPQQRVKQPQQGSTPRKNSVLGKSKVAFRQHTARAQKVDRAWLSHKVVPDRVHLLAHLEVGVDGVVGIGVKPARVARLALARRTRTRPTPHCRPRGHWRHGVAVVGTWRSGRRHGGAWPGPSELRGVSRAWWGRGRWDAAIAPLWRWWRRRRRWSQSCRSRRRRSRSLGRLRASEPLAQHEPGLARVDDVEDPLVEPIPGVRARAIHEVVQPPCAQARGQEQARGTLRVSLSQQA